jgi:hypothetical protein
MWYFACASNMNRRQIEARVQRTLLRWMVARLDGYAVHRLGRGVRGQWRRGKRMHYLAMSALFVLGALAGVGALAFPCGAQTPPPAPPVQNQAIQPPQAGLLPPTPSVGGSGQANAGPISVPAPGVGSTTSSGAGKTFGSAGQGLPGMPGGPPIKGSMGAQDPSSQYMSPLVIPPLLCDPAVNIPC